MNWMQTFPILCALATAAWGQECVDCHEDVTPGVVRDWRASEHALADVTCDACHGSEHNTAEDFNRADIPTPETCRTCHEDQVTQFARGKHALAWAAMKAMPTAHWQPLALMEGMKGCGGCHKIGLKSDEEIQNLKLLGQDFGIASCDACHTRHLFSVEEARQPQACQTCHMGFDHPQWEMYSASKHGVRNDLKQKGIIPEHAAAPTCQTCHMQQGNHEVRTAWGFLGVRLPMPEDPRWEADRATILQALGVLDPAGNPTPRLKVVQDADVVRTTQATWEREREQMLRACAQCHARSFAAGELAKGDAMIRDIDQVMAEAIRLVAGLYRDGILSTPQVYEYPFPDLLTFHDAPTQIEQHLFVMFLKHRMRAFQGVFHNNPDYALWYGWSEMQRDLVEIRDMAENLRERNRSK